MTQKPQARLITRIGGVLAEGPSGCVSTPPRRVISRSCKVQQGAEAARIFSSVLTMTPIRDHYSEHKGVFAGNKWLMIAAADLRMGVLAVASVLVTYSFYLMTQTLRHKGPRM
jgi:hypothetical protein